MRPLGLLIALFVSGPSFSSPSAGLWRKSGIDRNLVDRFINGEECSKSILCFRACGYAIEKGLAILEEKQMLVLSRPENIDVKASFQPFQIIEGSRVNDSKNPEDYFVHRKQAWDEVLVTMRAAFKTSPKAPWGKIIDYTESQLDEALIPELYGVILNGYTEVIFDSHSRFVPKDVLLESTNASSEDFHGYGIITIATPRGFLVKQVFHESPAESAGIRAGDYVISHQPDFVDYQSMGFESLAIQQSDSEKRTYLIRRSDEIFSVTLGKAKIKIDNVNDRMIRTPEGDYLGYIHISSLMPNEVCANVRAAIIDHEQNGAKGLLLDLRGNGGGGLDHSICVASLFIGKDKEIILSREPRSKVILDVHLSSDDKVTNLPVVVIVDHRSASGAELIAGALQHYERAFILGERTFGKGTVQQVRGVSGYKNLMLALTQSLFEYPSGFTHQLVGISPDIVVSEPLDTATRFQRRESWELNPLPATKKEVQPSAGFKKIIATVNACVSKYGSAGERMKGPQPSPHFSHDFQLYRAIDAFSCLNPIKLAENY